MPPKIPPPVPALHPSHSMLISRLFSNMERGIYEGTSYYTICAQALYCSNWGTETIEHNDEEVEAILKGMERVNRKWPFVLVPLYPPQPRPETLDQPLWIFDSTVMWPRSRNDPPSFEEIVAVATADTK